MGRELGRISGPLLAENLRRNGSNLAFDTKVLFVDVQNGRIGANTATPVTELYTPNTIGTKDLIVTATSNIGDFTVGSSTIQHALSSITISPNQSSNPTIETPGISTANLYVYGNTISNTIAGSDINFTASGTGQLLLNNNTLVSGNLRATGTITFDGNVQLGDNANDTISFTAEVNSDIIPSNSSKNLGSSTPTSLLWNTVYSNTVNSDVQIANISISGNTITSTNTDGDLNFTANGTSTVNIQSLKFYQNEITNIWPSATTNTQKSIRFSPDGTGNLEINSTKSLILPIGTNSNRTLAANGEIRFNSSNLNIEAYSSSGYTNFINMYSQDQKTYATAELTPNASDDTLRFAVNNVVTTTVTSTAITNNALYVGDVKIVGNSINNANSSNNIVLSTSGTGLVKFNGYNYVTGDTITLPTSGPVTINSTGNGYVKFGGTTALGIPVGTNFNYPASPVIGATRYNTTKNGAEVFNGTIWQPINGSSEVLSQEQVNDIMWIWDLTLG